MSSTTEAQQLKSDAAPGPHIEVEDLTMAYGSFVVQQDLTFTIRRGDIFIIMGDSGCGKSTLLRHMVGLMRPAKGQVLYEGRDFWSADPVERLSLIHISEPTRPPSTSRMPSSA